jgi:hypothetical protein
MSKNVIASGRIPNFLNNCPQETLLLTPSSLNFMTRHKMNLIFVSKIKEHWDENAYVQFVRATQNSYNIMIGYSLGRKCSL